MRFILSGILWLCVATEILAQFTPAPQPSRAVQLPLSGKDGSGESVATQETTASGPSIQVGGDYKGSVPREKAGVPAGAITLTLRDAIQKGLAANLGQPGLATPRVQRTPNASRH